MALGGATMGTTWRVLYAARDVDRQAIDRALHARLDGLVDELSHWSPTSRLSRFNAAPAGSWHALPPDFAHVMRAALRIATDSGGAFDPAIGALVDLWGFGPPGAMPPPDAAAVDSRRATGGVARLAWDDAAARLRQPGGLALDLSGIAKGHAADALSATLADAGIAHALVEVGGELVGRGVRPDGEPWWVDVESLPGSTAPPLRIALHGLAIATSGDYVRGRHNLDPRTGMPATTDVRAATVITSSAMAADAWATALLVLGSARALTLADCHGLAVRLETTTGERLSASLTRMIANDFDHSDRYK